MQVIEALDTLTRSLTGEWPGGVSPPGSLRTGREPLDSSGSHHPVLGPHTQPPVGEEGWVTSRDVLQPSHRPEQVAVQSLVLPCGPTLEVAVDAFEEGIQHGLVEAPVVVDPALHDRVDHQ